MDYQAPVAQSVERVAVKPPAGWWTKSVAYARVRVPSGAVLGPGRKIMDPGWGFLIQSFYFIEIIFKLGAGLAHSCWDTILLFY